MGELVVVRAPPGAWLVIDGCAADRAGYAQQVLDHYGARPSVVAMTHPHRDHANGLREVIEQATRGPVTDWPRLGMVPAPLTDGAGDTWDAFASLMGGVAEQVVATILSRWVTHPPCRWDLDAGSSQKLGDGTIHVLAPTKAERNAAVDAWTRDRKGYDYNRAATALLVTWQGRRVVLGSDLVERPGGGWTSALAHDARLNEHEVYKAAHHGSKGALGPQLVPPSKPRLRTWICTPFAPQGLPKPQDGEGLDQLLRIEDEVWLTGLPRAHAEQSRSARDMRRAELRDDPNVIFDDAGPEFPDCWVHVRVPRKGVASVTRGPGSVRVTR